MKLNEQDLKLFGELFAMCDAENTGKISGPKASELFITSGLSHEVLHEVNFVNERSNIFLSNQNPPMKLSIGHPSRAFKRERERERDQTKTRLDYDVLYPSGEIMIRADF